SRLRRRGRCGSGGGSLLYRRGGRCRSRGRGLLYRRGGRCRCGCRCLLDRRRRGSRGRLRRGFRRRVLSGGARLVLTLRRALATVVLPLLVGLLGVAFLVALVAIRGRRLGDPCLTRDRKSTRLNSSHVSISYAVFCLKK